MAAAPIARAPKIADSLSFLVNKLAQLAGRGMTEALTPLGVLPRESGILAALGQFGPMAQQRIGALLAIDRTTMVLSIDRLEELELVERTLHATDRRVFLVQLTRKGERAIGEAKTRLEAFEAELLAPLSSGERKRFRESLYRIVSPTLLPEARALSRKPS